MKRRRARQLALAFAGRPKRKRGAKTGPKPRPERVGFVAHTRRGDHDERNPVHVTMRRVARGPSLRAQRVVRAIGEVIRRAIARGIAILHYSIQDDHLHVIAEAREKVALARGMQWLFSRVAFEVNRVAARAGSLFRDRHFRHELASPSEVRRALVYVLMNGRKHAVKEGASLLRVVEWLDPCSTAAWLPPDAWRTGGAPPPDIVARVRAGPCPQGAPPRTWLASRGWLRGGGRIGFGEMPVVRLA